jgi:hypothetical protein
MTDPSRMRRRPPLVLVLVLVAVLLLAGACGSDETATTTGSAPPATDAPSAGTSSTTTTAAERTTTTVDTTTSEAPTTGAPTTSASPPTTPTPTTPAPAPAPTDPAPPPLPAGASSVFVLGDSVLLGTTMGSPPPLVAALPGWTVTMDCEGSRRLAQGLGVLQARRAEIGRVAVIQLGNNYIPGEHGGFGSQIDEAMGILEGTDRVVWVTVGEALSGRAELNAEIRAAAARHPTIVVADWAAMVAADPSLAPGDGLHLSNQGRAALSGLVAGAVGPAPA